MSAPPESAIDFRIRRRTGAFELDVEAAIPLQGVCGLFGASGSGKTSLIRCLAGLERPRNAEIRCNGKIWQDRTFFLPARQRRVGLVFQDLQLFQHLSVQDNLLYGYRRLSPEAHRITLDAVVDTLNISLLLDRKPARLSGGELQRVAIGRALLASPVLLLMDEPLASLDIALKEDILPYLRALPHEFGMPILYVTHDPRELGALASHLLLLHHGRITAQGPYLQTAQNAAILAREFSQVFVPENQSLRMLYDDAAASDGADGPGPHAGAPSRLRIHVRDVSFARQPPPESTALGAIPAIVRHILPMDDGAQALVVVEAAGQELRGLAAPQALAAGWLRPSAHIYAIIHHATAER